MGVYSRKRQGRGSAVDSLLFTPIELRGIRLKNRIVLSPMLTYSCIDGNLSDWHLVHLGKYRRRRHSASSSSGIDQGRPARLHHPADPGLWDDRFIAPMQRITAFIKQFGAVPGIQLSHSGRKSRHARPWEGRGPAGDRAASCPEAASGISSRSSAVPHEPDHPVPLALTRDGIRELVEAWGQGRHPRRQGRLRGRRDPRRPWLPDPPVPLPARQPAAG